MIRTLTTPTEIVGALRDRRHETGMSQLDLDFDAGCTQGHVGKIEVGTRSPTLHTLCNLMRPLGLALLIVPLDEQPPGE